VTFNIGAVGTVTAATATALTVTFSTLPTATGRLTEVVTTDGVNSGATVQVATVTSSGSGFSGGVIVPAATTTQVSVAVSRSTPTLIAVVSRNDGRPGTATGQVAFSFLH
jgi:hypothetical protein